jgi:integrase
VRVKAVSEMLGQSTIVITSDVYGHVLDEVRRDTADRVAGVLFG